MRCNTLRYYTLRIYADFDRSAIFFNKFSRQFLHLSALNFPGHCRTGGTSARVDRIASARERELRANRYAAWGVR